MLSLQLQVCSMPAFFLFKELSSHFMIENENNIKVIGECIFFHMITNEYIKFKPLPEGKSMCSQYFCIILPVEN